MGIIGSHLGHYLCVAGTSSKSKGQVDWKVPPLIL